MNIDSEITEEIRNTTGRRRVKKFHQFIKNAESNNFFDQDENSKFYYYLFKLKDLRNRIHIQNNRRNLEDDDHIAFSLDRKILAEKICEKILRHMEIKYYRVHPAPYVDNFEIPWTSHINPDPMESISF